MSPLAGVTLMEALIAGVLFSIIIFVVISVFPTCLLGMKRGEQLVNASQLAQELLEKRRVKAFDALPALEESEVDKPVLINGTAYAWSVTISPGSAGAQFDNLKQVAVEVTWEQSSTKKQSFLLKTQLYRPPNP